MFRKRNVQPVVPPAAGRPERRRREPAGPVIEHYAFGTMQIDGVRYRDDVKIVNGVASPDWWRRVGHLVEAGDIPDLIQSKPEVLVLGTGASGMMRVGETVLRAAERERFELIAKPTREAVDVYNKLAAGGRCVAAGFHLTC